MEVTKTSTEFQPPIEMSLDANELMQRSASEWHNQAVSCGVARDYGLLGQSQAWYYLKKTEKYTDLGYTSVYHYVDDNFSKSKQTTDKIIQIYDVYVETLGISLESLSNVGWGKLSLLCSKVNEDNVDELLELATDMTQRELLERVKEDDGLAPNETRDKNELIKMSFKVPEEMAEVIRTTIGVAKGLYSEMVDRPESDIPEGCALEMICAHFLTQADLEGDPRSSLQNAVRALETSYQVNINVTPKGEDNE